MVKRMNILFLILVLTGISIHDASAREPAPNLVPTTLQQGNVLGGRTLQLVNTGVLETDLTKAASDTINLYGGTNTLEGKFQTANGQPDPQGWLPIDETADTFWNVSNYQAADLDPDTPDNLAWWCGFPYPSCTEKYRDKEGGYGNSWDTWLQWSGAVTDPGMPATVTVTGNLNLDVEYAYDYLCLRLQGTSGYTNILTLDGQLEDYSFSETFVCLPGDFLGVASDEVHVRWHFHSDYIASDEDCLYPSVGAAQIDNLQVTIGQEGCSDLISPVETCQPGEPLQWAPGNTENGGCGNFGQLWTGLDDIDPDKDNHSPQWAFIDDGIIVPGTGGSYCTTWCYGPDGFVVNYTGGLCEDEMILNSVLSPPISLPRQNFSALVLSLDQYLHHDIDSSIYNGMIWSLESTADPTGSSGWVSYYDDFFHCDPIGRYFTSSFEIPRQELAPGAVLCRIRLYVFMYLAWNITDPPDVTPAPYFDNVRLQALKVTGRPNEYEMVDALKVSCRPNPFNPSVTISYAMPQTGHMNMQVYDMQGRLVNTLIDGTVAAGPGEVTWRGTDLKNHTVAAGIYFCRIETDNARTVRKLLMVK